MEYSMCSPATTTAVALNAEDAKRGIDLLTRGPPDCLDKLVLNKYDLIMSSLITVLVVTNCTTE